MVLSLVAALRAVFSAATALALAASGSAGTPASTVTSTSTASTGTGRPTAGAVVRGQATHYGPASTGGNCSFPSVPGDRFTVAAGPDLYARGAGCGGYLTVTAGARTIRVKIDNLCPECRPGHLDLTDEAFAALAPLGKGLIPITYRPVTNPKITGGLAFVVKTGSSRYWLGLLVDDAGNRLRTVEVKAGSGWQVLTRTDYGYWLAPSGAGAGPFTVRITDVAGHRAVATGVKLTPNAVQRTSVRLYP
jgi:expansin (peptidoglycan-binding protein)